MHLYHKPYPAGPRKPRRSNYSTILIFSGLLLSATYASAQDAGIRQISGTITDAGTKEGLPGASIRALGSDHGTVADAEGNFSLSLPDSAARVVVSYVGFENDTLDVAAGTTPFTVALRETRNLKEVTIESRRKSTEINLLGTMKTEKIGSRELMKAACCNLSESFETTPSVDVGFTDAVSGYKQIQMLGLAGSYTSFTRENIPDVRGLAAITGLTFTPGAWVESMQLSKGAGSVVNGYEGTAGQINIEWRKPFAEKEPRLYLNGYQSVQGRTEGNLVLSHKFSESLSTNLLLHGRGDWAKIDQNKDGFLDQPLGQTFVGSNRWFYFGKSGLEIQGGIKGVYLDNTGGQKAYSKGTEQVTGNPWGYEQQIKRVEGWAKIGKVFPAKSWKSMGLQLSGIYHDQQSLFGGRNYDGRQKSFYANYIYQTIIGNTNNIIKGGASFQADDYKESFTGAGYKRTEYVPGAFVEYAYNYLTKFSVVAGLRGDYHNIFGAFVTPRLHVRYAPLENTVFRASAGRAQRTANIFAENLGYMASNRAFVVNGNGGKAYGLNPEVAWNMGLNFTKKFMLNYRDGAFSMDYYYTDFTNQVVVDIEQPHEVKFYNLNGKSYAHSFQAQLDYEPVRNLDVRLAYRYYDVRATYEGVLKQKPLIAPHRAFMNIGYETKNSWKFDYTLQWVGTKRIPAHLTDDEPGGHVMDSQSPSFVQMNAQISKSWQDGNVEVYLGGENLTGYMQHNLILGASDPYGKSFDGSLVWGPAMGRNFYVGFRYKLK
ncbi:TonB-dependent receptor [Taibaiella chishuiensis]|uniref:Outer membrane receptor protein involved in Fe transport n=1 Tax=Taibaiella chishuiensis TaxID=1434707 RepID=A0A2P8DCL8_9BACT|nr:TonB-dependent receptor [Taibaiella chishuiensis]PSK94968.1 outer membrane receptor protein involved in Fe transport [Taibaiella chishuiensis]